MPKKIYHITNEEKHTIRNKTNKNWKKTWNNVLFWVQSLKNVTQVDASNFALKTNLANLKTEVNKLDIEKLAPIPIDLSKLSDVLKNDAVRKTVYDKLVTKVNHIDTSDFVLKTKYNTDKTELEKKILNVPDFI